MTANARDTDHPNEKLYTIGTVSKLTGVGAITLRAWERRYGLVEPIRKESGHRLFTRAHIDQINRITALIGSGMRVSQIHPEMLRDETADGSEEHDREWREYRSGMMAAIIAFDENRLEEIYHRVLSLYPIGLVTNRLLTPLLVELGDRWEQGKDGVAEEHFFAFYLRNKLGARFHHRGRPDNGPLLLIASLPGEYHEIGLLLFALAAHDSGYRILPLGANMPLDAVTSAARKSDCDAIVLCGAIEPARATLTQDLPALVEKTRVPVLVGGLSSVDSCDEIGRAGAEVLGKDIDHGLKRLREILG
ncbi:MAG: MerR family transcriptional regulator [Xanthomonadales bacterium]|nr:MerR family transcriptional regulator [Xanthomonadales bacterium]